ncbi:MAG TPA: response regulator transcription factor [Chloroflexia bacterium]|nr:response regulator transcription factor [Chloroflexia bacterium]
MKHRILVIDDDANITSFLKRALSYEGYLVDTAANGTEGLARALEQAPDLVVLDVMMPGLDGYEVAHRLRAGGPQPILMLTARDAVPDRVQGLDSGADDYLVKPFALDELLARVRALLRRTEPATRSRLHLADLTVDVDSHEVRRGPRAVELTSTEFDLLVTLLRHPRQVLSRDTLLESVWGMAPMTDSHVVEVYIGYLRQKLEAGSEPRLIHTVRGVGYVLKETPA